MNRGLLSEIAKQLTLGGKGIWATDATEETMNIRMEAVGIKPTADLRKKFREILIGTDGLSNYISGVILNDEIIMQTNTMGTMFSDYVSERGMIPGIKVDKKYCDMANFPGESVTEGLDGLRERLIEYRQMGAKFTKWRCVFTVSNDLPTQTCVDSNAEVLARYAALAQEQEMVPIVEPEVLLGGKHNIERSEEVNLQVLNTVFDFLKKHKVYLEGVVLKTAWVHSGLDNSNKPDSEEIAEATIRVLRNCVPINIGGVVFLSGGDTPQDASDHLDKVAEMSDLPWSVGFSFERALEGAAMKEWMGKDENSEKAKAVLLQRAKLNSLAKAGTYEKDMEKDQ